MDIEKVLGALRQERDQITEPQMALGHQKRRGRVALLMERWPSIAL